MSIPARYSPDYVQPASDWLELGVKMPKRQISSRRRTSIQVSLGDCIVLPLFDGLFAVAWIAWSKGQEILGHIFAPFTASELTVERLTERTDWTSPLLICRFGDLGIMRGEWQLLPIPDCSKRTWAVPTRFGTSLEAIRLAYVVTTEPNHPDQVVSRCPATVEEALELPSEDLYGYRAVEIALSMLITPLGAQCRDPASGDSNASFSARDFRKEPARFRHLFPRGTVFALPLERDGWMHGVVVRRSEGMVLASFFGPKRAKPLVAPGADLDGPLVWTARIALGAWDYENIKTLELLDAIPAHLAVDNEFGRSIWAYPSGRYDFRVRYDLSNLDREVACIRITQHEAETLPPDWRLGGLGVAKVLARL